MVSNPINVRLGRCDLGRAEQAAALRYQLARASGVEDRLIDKWRSGKEADLPGIKAEIAVSKLLAIDFNPNDLGIDNGCDLYVPLGSIEVAIQVKSTYHKDAKWLLGTPHAKANWDISVFVRPTDSCDVMQVYGWIQKESYQKKLEVIELGHGKQKGVNIKFLKDMELLWRWLMQTKHG